MKPSSKILAPPLQSTFFRGWILGMTLIYVVMACSFYKTAIPMVVLYVAIAAVGSYTSYWHRNDVRNSWINWFVASMVLGAGANLFRELITQCRDQLDMLAAVIHFLTFVYVVNTFELKRRSDFKFAIVFPLLLLCLSAAIVRGYAFGLFVFIYICMWAGILYGDCLLSARMEVPSDNLVPRPREIAAPQSASPASSGLVIVALLPCLAAFAFLFMPRIENVVDMFLAAIQNMTRSQPNPSSVQKSASNAPRPRYVPAQAHPKDNSNPFMSVRLDGEEAASRSSKRMQLPDSEHKRLSGRTNSETGAHNGRSGGRSNDIASALPNHSDLFHHKAGSGDGSVSVKGKAPGANAAPTGKQLGKLPGKHLGASNSSAKTSLGTAVALSDKKSNFQGTRLRESAMLENHKRSPNGVRAHNGAAQIELYWGKESLAGGRGVVRAIAGAESGEGFQPGQAGSSSLVSQSGGADGVAGKSGLDGTEGRNGNAAGKGSSASKETPSKKASDASQDRQDADPLVLTLVSSRPVYLRWHVFDTFDGHAWYCQSEDKLAKAAKTSLGAPPVPSPTAPPRASAPVGQPTPGQNGFAASNSGPFGSTPANSGLPANLSPFGSTPNNSGLPANVRPPGSTPANSGLPANLSPFGSTPANSGLPANVRPPGSSAVNQAIPATNAPPAPVNDTAGGASEGGPTTVGSTTASGLQSAVFSANEKGKFSISQAESLQLPPDLTGIDIPMNFRVEIDNFGQSVPLAWLPKEVVSSDLKKLVVDPWGTVSQDTSLSKGCRYSAVSKIPIYDLNTLRKTHLMSAEDEDKTRTELRRYLSLPDSLSNLSPVVSRITDSNDNWFVQADHICKYLRQNCILLPADVGGNPNLDPVSDFILTKKSGSDRMFATAMTLMCRWAGIPSRVVFGLGPGDVNQLTGSRELHWSDYRCWSEVYIPGYSWIPFDPTPEGFLPAQEPESGMNPVKTKVERAITDRSSLSIQQLYGRFFTWVAAIAALLSCVALFPLVKMLLTAWRRSIDAKRRHGPAFQSYLRVLRDLRQINVPVTSCHTPTEIATAVSNYCSISGRDWAQGSDLQNKVDEFMRTYNAVFFGQQTGLEVVKKLEAEIHAICRARHKASPASRVSVGAPTTKGSRK